jgi:hypothetical protein
MTLENTNNLEQLLRLELKLQTEHTKGDEKKYDKKRDIITGFKEIGLDLILMCLLCVSSPYMMKHGVSSF